MARKLLGRGFIGFLCGVAIDYIVAIIVSCQLELGYFMACLTTLPEMLGGEMNAVILQTFACGLAGFGVALAHALAGAERWRLRTRAISATVTITISLAPLAALGIAMAMNSPY